MDPLNFNYMTNVCPQNYFYPKYEEVPINKQESFQLKNEDQNENSN